MGLSVVPSEVWESGEIIEVNLSRPSKICHLNSPHVYPFRNNIKDWPLTILKSLSNLYCLKLDNNPQRQIPSDGFQAISMLQIRDLSGNAASLPENLVFSSLPHLKELYLRRMQLREVPPEIMSFCQLQILDLAKIPFNQSQSIRRPILDRETKAILKYLKDKLPKQ